MKMGGAGAPGISPLQQAQMEKARAQMEAMQKQGGPQGAVAAQALARMGAISGGGGGMEITSESTGFSADPVPDSVFAIPAGYQQSSK
jgi:predicted phage gp36 major capsid-like protein